MQIPSHFQVCSKHLTGSRCTIIVNPLEYRQVHIKFSVYLKINILKVLKLFCHLFSTYVSYFPRIDVHPEPPVVEEQLQPNIDWVSSRTLTNSLREVGKSFLFIFFCPHPNWGRILWPSVLSYFANVHQVVTVFKPILRTGSFGNLVWCLLCFDKFMVLTFEQTLVTFQLWFVWEFFFPRKA